MIKSKLPNTNQSIFSTIHHLIEETGAIDVAIGKSDFCCPEELTGLAMKYLKNGYNDFAPLEGIPKLREVIAQHVFDHYQHHYDPATEITITAGTIQAVHTVITAIVKEEDEVIVFEPAFESYAPSIILNGGKPVYMELKEPTFRVDWEELRKMINSKTRMILINSPQNPTGAVFSEEDMVQLQKLTNGTNIILLADELFELIVYDNQIHQSISRFKKLTDRSFIVSSFGVPFNINGWGIAHCLAPSHLMAEYRKMQYFQLYNVNTPLQHALADYLANKQSFSEISEFYQGKRNYFSRLLDDSLYGLIPARGGYFQLLDYSKLSDEADHVFVDRLARDFGVAAIPISAFYHEKNKLQAKYIRLCFAKENSKLEQAAERLLQVPSMILGDL